MMEWDREELQEIPRSLVGQDIFTEIDDLPLIGGPSCRPLR